MGKMECAEAVYDTLEKKGKLVVGHGCFDDIYMACYGLACGDDPGADVIKWISARDRSRSEAEICRDICRYFRKHKIAVRPSSIFADAIAAGRAALVGEVHG